MILSIIGLPLPDCLSSHNLLSLASKIIDSFIKYHLKC